MGEIAIEVRNLTKKFGDFTAVNNLTFTIEKGKIFGFLGPNGSGKSTTIRMLCGVLAPTSGEGYVFGHDIAREPDAVRQNLGYMSQKFSLYEDLTVNENMNFYSAIYSIPKKLADERKQELIEMANLKGKENSLAGTLSGGWKQRLALGCALIHKPRLLVLDEPTAGVDPVSRRVFWEIIHTLAKQGITVLVTTHYMDEAESCDELGFILNGVLAETGGTREIIERAGADCLEDVFISMIEEKTGQKITQSFKNMRYLEENEK